MEQIFGWNDGGKSHYQFKDGALILYEEVYILCLTMVDPGNKTHEDYMEKQTNKKPHTQTQAKTNKQKQRMAWRSLKVDMSNQMDNDLNGSIADLLDNTRTF